MPIALSKLNTFGLSKTQLASLLLAFIVCVWGLWAGIASGLATSRSQATYKNAQGLADALKFYASDQEVFPTIDQFSNKNILVPFYLSAMPAPLARKGACANFAGWQYNRLSEKQFTLDYCLEKKVDGQAAGVHRITEKDLK